MEGRSEGVMECVGVLRLALKSDGVCRGAMVAPKSDGGKEGKISSSLAP